MTITFLGTGPARPILDRRGRSRRLHTATLFTKGAFSLLLDAGPSIVEQLRRFRVHSLSAVALTHRHADAAGGLARLDRWTRSPLLVFVGPGERHHYQPQRFRRLAITAWRPGVPFMRSPFSVTAFPVLHATDPRRFPTHGFHVRAGRWLITYASDLKDLPPALHRYFRGNDLLIVDGAGWERDLPNHRGILNHVREYADAGNKRILFTQIGRPVPNHEAANRLLRAVSPCARLAYDGMVLRL